MMNADLPAPIEFATVNDLLIAHFMCRDVSTMEVIDQLLEEFKKKIEDMPEKDLLIDFTGVTFVATSAINLLLVVLKRVRMKGGDVFLCGINDNIGQIYELMQINRLFDIFPTREEAVKKIGK
jgi:anti-anti-sigma factor